MTCFRHLISYALGVGLMIAAVPPDTASGAAAVRLERMPVDLEVRFALSALPPHLRDKAAVMVLDPAQGYVMERPGGNGFTCIVERTEWPRADFRDDVYTPLCYDAEGSRNHLQVYLDVARLRAGGEGAAAVRDKIAKRFATKHYRAPVRAGLSYMLAPLMRTYTNPNLADHTVATFSMPHHMVYAPNLTAQDIGSAMPPSPFAFIFEPGPHGYMVIPLGEREAASLRDASRSLINDLCHYRKSLCLEGVANHK